MNSRTPRTQLYRGIFSGSSGERVEGRTARFFSFVERDTRERRAPPPLGLRLAGGDAHFASSRCGN